MSAPQLLVALVASLALVGCDGKTPVDTDPATGTPAGTGSGTGASTGGGTGTGTGTATGNTGSTFQLGFRGQYPLNAGQTMHFGVVDDSQDLVWSTSITVPGDGNLDEVFDATVGVGAHVLFYWADVDGNGTCEGPAVDLDHGWSEQIGNPVSAQEMVQRNADQNFAASTCGLSW